MNGTGVRARTAPPCRHFGVCGGCSQLDVPIDGQLAAKAALVEQCLAEHLGGVRVEWAPADRAPRHTRIKLLHPIQPHAELGLKLGLYERGSHRTIEIEQCQVQDPALTRLGRRAQRVLRRCGRAPYDEVSGGGFLRAFGARLAPGTGELLLGIVTKGGEWPEARDVAAALVEAAEGLRDARGRRVRAVGIVRNLHDRGGNALLGRRSVPLCGRDYQEDRQAGLRLRLSFGSFYQSHRGAEHLLYRPALELVGPLPGLRVVDAYGGVGAFGLRLARAGANVEIVEANAAACRDARANAASNDLCGVRVTQAPFDRFAGDGPVDLLVVDPPRAGLGESGRERALALRPARILYASCAPASLSRDLAGLCAGGYRVQAVRAVDLFPHTEHVETLCLLCR